MEAFSEVPIGQPAGVSPASSTLANLFTTEIAGRVTYSLASDRVELLRQVEEEHRSAAEALKACLGHNGLDEPAACESLGVWSTAARAAVAGNLLTLLQALRQAEQAVFNGYETSLPSLDAGSARVVQNKLIPAQSRRIRLVSQLLNGVEATRGSARPA